jgi:hypothetical protein
VADRQHDEPVHGRHYAHGTMHGRNVAASFLPNGSIDTARRSAMHLVQILLPVYDAAGKRYSQAENERVTRELTERFGGLTAYVRSPAEGLWKQEPGTTVLDDIVVYEVMVEHLDRDWWSHYRAQLSMRYGQQDLVIRSHAIERL